MHAHVRLFAGTGLALLLGGAGGASGQLPSDTRGRPGADPTGESGTARVVGRVLEYGRNAGIEGVRVTVEGVDRTVITGADGRFILGSLSRGSHRIRAEHAAYLPVSRIVELPESGVAYEVEIRLSVEAIPLDPVRVEVVRLESHADPSARMEWMARLGLGSQVDRRGIELSGASRLSHLLAREPGVQLNPVRGRTGAQQVFLSRGGCEPSVYVDGILSPLFGGSIDDLVPLAEVESVEVYRRLSSLPGELADERARRCGAVAIHTRRHAEGTQPFGWRRMVTLSGFLGLTYLLNWIL
jgi:hypothetical protein